MSISRDFTSSGQARRLKENESPDTDRVRAVERKNTERDVSRFPQVEKRFDLGVHHISVTKTHIEDKLVEDGTKLERIVPGQHLPPS